MPEFKKWPSIKRNNPFNVTITEKIDGTNACVVIEDSEIVGVQSRNRFITVESDNFGFAKWVEENKEELLTLGDGYHYGEWAGPGIQKNHHCLEKKEFFLFNVFRPAEAVPSCCKQVPILFQGEMDKDTVANLLSELQDREDGYIAEGVVVYYHAFKTRSKHTIKSPNGKWCK